MTKKKTYVLIVSETFPVHHFRKGEKTHFISKILNRTKLHTLRNNYDWWKKRIDAVNANKAVISLRIWNGKPYVDKQIEILKITKLTIQKAVFEDDGVWIDKTTFLPLAELAKNDGLTLEELNSWFKGKPTGTKALIQFSNFVYK